MVLGSVAGLAADRLRGRDERVGVRRVAADAVAFGMADGLLMARRTRARRIGVWRVTGRAGRVLGGSEHRLIAVAARARFHLGFAEPMGLMAPGTARVAGRQRAVVDVQLAGTRRVAPRAALIRGVLGLVHAMAIEAAPQTRVSCLLGRMTARARLGIERGRSVSMMAIAAWLIGVRTDRVPAVLRAIVASHARRFRTRAKAVAVLAARCVTAGMQRRWLAGVAAIADVRGRRRESAVAVAGLACDLADVCDVTGARRDVAIRRRNLLRYAILAGAAAADREHDQYEHAPHGLEPIG